jgi:hypothetical protein
VTNVFEIAGRISVFGLRAVAASDVADRTSPGIVIFPGANRTGINSQGYSALEWTIPTYEFVVSH